MPPVRVSHGKVAEMQRRAAVHFHVLLRLDGVNPDDPDALVPPPGCRPVWEDFLYVYQGDP